MSFICLFDKQSIIGFQGIRIDDVNYMRIIFPIHLYEWQLVIKQTENKKRKHCTTNEFP